MYLPLLLIAACQRLFFLFQHTPRKRDVSCLREDAVMCFVPQMEAMTEELLM